MVADASAVVDYLLRGRSSLLRDVFRSPDMQIHVPALCDVEVVAAFRRLLRGSELSEERTAEALHDYLDMPLTRHGHKTLMARALQLRENFSAYDATYVALAEGLRGSLATVDRKLANGVRAHLDLDLVPTL